MVGIHGKNVMKILRKKPTMFKNWGNGVEPPEFTTKEEVQEMIDAAIRKHNRNASIISMCVGWVVLALFAEGLLRLIGVIDPIFPWLKITL
jgi:hypothetical protein